MGQKNYYIHPVAGRSGGLWLLWKDYVSIDILEENKFYFHTKIKMLAKQLEVFVTFIHAPSNPEPRAKFWKEFNKLDPSQIWCVIGDYNEYEAAWEKWGLPIRKTNCREVFKEMTKICDLQDMGSSGVTYTWSNK